MIVHTKDPIKSRQLKLNLSEHDWEENELATNVSAAQIHSTQTLIFTAIVYGHIKVL